MLAYPTPTFDARTIRSAPGYRPVGKSGCAVPSDEVVAESPLNTVNRDTKNGFVGTRAKKFIQNNQFLNEHYDPTKGTPLSKPGSVGNVGDQFISAGRPYMAEPKNEELRLIMNILDGKPIAEEHKGKLTAGQVKAMGEKSERLSARPSGEMGIIDDLKDSQDAMKEANRIRNAMAQGFTYEEAKKAYEKLREREAEKALFMQQDTSVRLYDLIDSKVGGTQNPLTPGNDESALALAVGRNKRLVDKAIKTNEGMDRKTQATTGEIAGLNVRLTAPQVVGFQTGKVPRLPSGITRAFAESAFEALPITTQRVVRPGQPLMLEDRPPTLSFTPLAGRVAETLAQADIKIFRPKKKGGRPKGRGDTAPRMRRTKAEIEAERKAQGL